MNAISKSTMFEMTPLEIKAESLAALLRAGLEEDFGRLFQRETKSIGSDQAEQLIELVNHRLAVGTRRRNLKLMLSHQSSSITLVDRSRLFGDSFAVARQTFAI